MTERTMHATDQQLLLYADGELSSRAAARLRAHLELCAECRTRVEHIQKLSAGIGQAQSQAAASIDSVADLSGPRALLKARLTASARQFSAVNSTPLRLARSLAYACALVLLAVIGAAVLHQRHTPLQAYTGPLPNPGVTPGSTRQVSLAEICSEDREEVVRAVPADMQRRVFEKYGIKGAPAENFEVDYLITPGLGGADDLRNLWPEPHANTPWNSYVKDQLEDHLHRMVCDHKLSLGEAQRELASNWIAAYKKYFHTEQPLARPMEAGMSEPVHLRTALRRKHPLA